MTGLVGVFIPFGKTMDLVFAIGGCLLFSGYIVYDTYIINARLSPDEYIMGAISLYLECVWLIYTSCRSLKCPVSLVLSIFVSCFMFCITSSLTWSYLVINILRLLSNLEDR